MLRGNKLKMLRIYQDRKQMDLAKYVGKTKNYISMLENEKQAIPTELYEKWLTWLNSPKIRQTELKKNDKSKDENKENK